MMKDEVVPVRYAAPVREYGPEQYAVEYLIKGETTWRRTIAHPLNYVGVQQDELTGKRWIAASRIVAFCESTRLLTGEELAVVRKGESSNELSRP